MSLLPTVVRRHQYLPLGRHRNVPRTSHCLCKATLDSLRTPQISLSDSTPLQWILPTRPTLFLRTIQLFIARLSSLQNAVAVHPNVSDANNKHLNSDKSRNHINLRNTHVYMKTNNKAALSHNISTSCLFKKKVELSDFPCHLKRTPPVKTAIWYDDTRDR